MLLWCPYSVSVIQQYLGWCYEQKGFILNWIRVTSKEINWEAEGLEIIVKTG